jgi:hypothetical protein
VVKVNPGLCLSYAANAVDVEEPIRAGQVGQVDQAPVDLVGDWHRYRVARVRPAFLTASVQLYEI